MHIYKASVSLSADIFTDPKYKDIHIYSDLPVIEFHLNEIDENDALIYMDELSKKYEHWWRVSKKEFSHKLEHRQYQYFMSYTCAIAVDEDPYVGYIFRFIIVSADYESAKTAAQNSTIYGFRRFIEAKDFYGDTEQTNDDME